MDEADRLETQRRARQLRSARRRRLGELRRKTLLFSSLTFAAAWLVVFGQMALGRDPVLSPHKTTASAAGHSARAQPARPQPASTVVVDPVSGLVERVPIDQESSAPAAPAPPPPVTTSQS
jgi:hypothetical protein